MKKRNHEIFWGFPKSGMKILSKLFFKFFFFFFEKKYILEISSPDFGNPKNFMIFVFSSPEFGQKSFPAWKRFRQDLVLQFGISSFPCFKNTFFLQISFMTSLEISTITIGSKVCNPLLRAESSPKVKPSIFLPFISVYPLKRFVFSS